MPCQRVVGAGVFQFALPRGERLRLHRLRLASVVFQFALPRGERPAALTPTSWSRSFNSRSRVGSDAIGTLTDNRLQVSIRAPAWGATHQQARCHSPLPCFNSRSRVGSDHFHPANAVILRVSIRAPAWGATLSTPGHNGRAQTFQFALPRGERPAYRSAHRRHRCFNSRSRVGSDTSTVAPDMGGAVSIRAPAWGATPAHDDGRQSVKFQFALPRGERRCNVWQHFSTP